MRKIVINKTGGRLWFWQKTKNINTLLRLVKAKNIHYSYRMPYGGRDEGDYFIGEIKYQQHD